jgi:hypothetical protein
VRAARREFIEGSNRPVAAVLFPGHDGGSRGGGTHNVLHAIHSRNRSARIEWSLRHGQIADAGQGCSVLPKRATDVGARSKGSPGVRPDTVSG